jgi:CRISPR-associated protein Cas6
MGETMALSIGSAVDLDFAVRGDTLPADHGYSLFAAACRVLPWLHAADGVGVHPIRGRLIGGRALALTPYSRLTLRLPASRIAEALPLAGQQLDIDGALLTVGVPTVRPLRPAPTVISRLVVIKGFLEPEGFVEAARRQAAAIGLGGRLALVARSGNGSLEGTTGREAGEPIRRTLRVREKTIVGFALAVTELTAEESIRVQEAGLGGRRRFGCGLFTPAPAGT